MFQLDLTEKKPYLDKSLKNFDITLIFIFIFSIVIYSQEKTIIRIEKAEFFEKNEEKACYWLGSATCYGDETANTTLNNIGYRVECLENGSMEFYKIT